MTTFTQGPWQIVDGEIVDANGNAILPPARNKTSYINTAARKANAKLMAASPDLLEAAKRICTAILTANVNMEEFDGAAWDAMQDAIAKACGQ